MENFMDKYSTPEEYIRDRVTANNGTNSLVLKSELIYQLQQCLRYAQSRLSDDHRMNNGPVARFITGWVQPPGDSVGLSASNQIACRRMFLSDGHNVLYAPHAVIRLSIGISFGDFETQMDANYPPKCEKSTDLSKEMCCKLVIRLL